MAPRRLYETPLEQLSRLMRDARERGLKFEDAWEEAMRPGCALVMTTTPAAPATAVRWPTDRTDRMQSMDVILSTREGWHRAYDRVPPNPGEVALGHLAEIFSRMDEAMLRKLARAQVVEGIRSGSAVASAA